jgi:hypothetical protein
MHFAEMATTRIPVRPTGRKTAKSLRLESRMEYGFYVPSNRHKNAHLVVALWKIKTFSRLVVLKVFSWSPQSFLTSFVDKLAVCLATTTVVQEDILKK